MITKETARRIYNCYQQIEEIDKLKEEMLTEIEKVRENEEKNNDKPIPESSFGRFGKGMQLGVPDGLHSSMRVFNISPTIGLKVMDEQREKLEKDMRELETIARLELYAKKED
jgi:hypothetical protein